MQEVLGVGQPMYFETTQISRALLLAFVLCVTVVMLNVLIAQFTITYERVLSAESHNPLHGRRLAQRSLARE